jgi:hypothetical protein
MLNYNATCQIAKAEDTDVYGQPLLGTLSPVEKCAIVKLRKEMKHTTVRADSSQSRGHGDEFVGTHMVLLDSATVADLGDQLNVKGFKIKITSMHPRWDVTGEIDHYEVTGELWPS